MDLEEEAAVAEVEGIADGIAEVDDDAVAEESVNGKSSGWIVLRPEKLVIVGEVVEGEEVAF